MKLEENRVCSGCGRTLAIEEFNFHSKAKNIRESKCRTCRNTYKKNNYLKGKLRNAK